MIRSEINISNRYEALSEKDEDARQELIATLGKERQEYRFKKQ